MTSGTTETPARRLPPGLMLSRFLEAVDDRSAERSRVSYLQQKHARRHRITRKCLGTTMAPLTEVELVEKAQKGDDDAFVELLDRCGLPALKHIRRRISSDADRKEVEQDWRRIALKGIRKGKFDTKKYTRAAPFLWKTADFAIHQFREKQPAAPRQVLKNDPRAAFIPGVAAQRKKPADEQIADAERLEELIQGVLSAGVPAHQLMAFLSVKFLEENPAAAPRVPDRNKPRKIAGAYWHTPFRALKGVILGAYAAESEIPLTHVHAFFADLDHILADVEDKCFADFGGTSVNVNALYGWTHRARKTIIEHLS